MSPSASTGVYALALHGGAGALSASRLSSARLAEMRRDLEVALERGTSALERGGSALDAAVEAVCVLEDSRVFNAARGAVLRRDGSVRLDAAVMFGAQRRAGAVSLVQTPQNPVRLALSVLEREQEVLLSGAAADRRARQEGLPTRRPTYFVTGYRTRQLERLRAAGGMALDHDVAEGAAAAAEAEDEGQTVGAVALDRQGHLAAATSTGGLVNADPGRVGDSPIIGAGTWAADGSCAVSATGSGECFIRTGFAHSVHARLAWAGLDLDAACRAALEDVVSIGGQGGCVAIDARGHVAAPFTTAAMPRAYRLSSGERRVHVLEADFASAAS